MVRERASGEFLTRSCQVDEANVGRRAGSREQGLGSARRPVKLIASRTCCSLEWAGVQSIATEDTTTSVRASASISRFCTSPSPFAHHPTLPHHPDPVPSRDIHTVDITIACARRDLHHRPPPRHHQLLTNSARDAQPRTQLLHRHADTDTTTSSSSSSFLSAVTIHRLRKLGAATRD